MNIAVHGREFSSDVKEYVQQIFDELAFHQVTYQLSHSFSRILKEAGILFEDTHIYHSTESIFAADLVLSIGGDGTVLETIAHVGNREIPVLGINFGRLGFLASVPTHEIKRAIEKVVRRQYVLDARTMLQATTPIGLFQGQVNFALNEIALSKTDTSSMIIVHTYINNQFLNSYWADGLMVATATGSTGYSLSCGGPLVMPHSANFIITPICPHNLFVRPMIVSDDSVIALKVESRSNNFLVSMDSRARVTGDVDTFITIKKESFKAHLITLEGDEFLITLRQKLGWGKDIRNKTPLTSLPS
ncbi:MAG: NAD kinase [Spirosomataceae bacterium]